MGHRALGDNRRVLFDDRLFERAAAWLLGALLMNFWSRLRRVRWASWTGPSFAVLDEVTAWFRRGRLVSHHWRRAAIDALARCAICKRRRCKQRRDRKCGEHFVPNRHGFRLLSELLGPAMECAANLKPDPRTSKVLYAIGLTPRASCVRLKGHTV